MLKLVDRLGWGPSEGFLLRVRVSLAAQEFKINRQILKRGKIKFTLSKILDKKPEFLSGGEKQRVAVARALINNPSLLLADEPTGNLDSDNAKKIQELFKKINKELGVTIVLVTHNEKFSKIARKCLVLKDGKWSK